MEKQLDAALWRERGMVIRIYRQQAMPALAVIAAFDLQTVQRGRVDLAVHGAQLAGIAAPAVL